MQAHQAPSHTFDEHYMGQQQSDEQKTTMAPAMKNWTHFIHFLAQAPACEFELSITNADTLANEWQKNIYNLNIE